MSRFSWIDSVAHFLGPPFLGLVRGARRDRAWLGPALSRRSGEALVRARLCPRCQTRGMLGFASVALVASPRRWSVRGFARAARRGVCSALPALPSSRLSGRAWVCVWLGQRCPVAPPPLPVPRRDRAGLASAFAAAGGGAGPCEALPALSGGWVCSALPALPPPRLPGRGLL